jgi:hypothetical protein
MTLHHRGRDSLDLVASADVTQLILGAELLRECAQPVLAARKQDRMPAPAGELPRDRRPDPARGARDDGYSF